MLAARHGMCPFCCPEDPRDPAEVRTGGVIPVERMLRRRSARVDGVVREDIEAGRRRTAGRADQLRAFLPWFAFLLVLCLLPHRRNAQQLAVESNRPDS